MPTRTTGQPTLEPRAIMEMIGGADLSPSRRRLLEMLIAQQAGADPAAGEVVDGEIAPPDESAGASAEARLDLAERRVADLEDILASVAEALGACSDCFGTDPSCPNCAGRGGPGAFAPDREAFSFFVLPVLNRLKRRRKPSADHAAEARKTVSGANLERSA